MGEDGGGQHFRPVRKGRHQERRPIHRVEAQDVLADHVHDLGLARNIPPILLKFGLTRRVIAPKTYSRHVGGERVIPDVKDLLGVVRPGDAPLEAFAADRNVSQAALHEALHFVEAEVRAHEFRVLLVEFKQAVLERGEFEEIVLLADQFGGPPANIAVHGLGAVGNIALVGNAVAAFVPFFFDISVLGGLAQHPLDGADVVGISGGVNELVFTDIQKPPELLEELALQGDKHARGFPLRVRCALDFFAVLVGAGEEGHIVSAHALVTRNHVADDGGVRGSHVRPRVGVVNRSGEIELFH